MSNAACVGCCLEAQQGMKLLDAAAASGRPLPHAAACCRPQLHLQLQALGAHIVLVDGGEAGRAAVVVGS